MFERLAGVYHLYLGGPLIRTTAEHPFSVAFASPRPASRSSRLRSTSPTLNSSMAFHPLGIEC